MRPKLILAREAYLFRMQAQIREITRELAILQRVAERAMIKAELDDIFDLYTLKDLMQQKCQLLENETDELWHQHKLELDQICAQFKRSIDKLKVDFNALTTNYSAKRTAQLENFSIQMDQLLARVEQAGEIQIADFADDIKILCLKHTTAIERLQALTNADGASNNYKASFESAWYELLITYNSLSKQLSDLSS